MCVWGGGGGVALVTYLDYGGCTVNALYCHFVILDSFINLPFLMTIYSHGYKASKSYHVQISYYFLINYFDFTMYIHCHFFQPG